MGIIPYFLIFIYSIILISINKQGIRFINRSLGSSLIAIITIITSVSLVYLFKEKAADVLCYGLIINYIMHIIINLRVIGISGLMIHMLNPLNTFQSVFEVHSFGFTLNLLLIFYLSKKGKKNIGIIISILVILYLIMKRIAFIGLFFALFVCILTEIVFRKRSKKKYIIIMWSLVIGSLLYVAFISLYPQLYQLLMDRLGILNRYLMANSFSDYYDFDIRFIGRGFGFVSVLMPDMNIAGASVEALHNDILKDFIEQGFIGFCIIYYYLFVKVPRVVTWNKSNRCYGCVTMMLSYTFITLLTDNVLEYVPYTCTLFTLYGIIHLYGNQIFSDTQKIH